MGKPNGRNEKMIPSGAWYLIATMADTTWRMFLTPIIGAMLGWWADSTWHTFPWFSLTGVILGCGVTALLIKRLLQKV